MPPRIMPTRPGSIWNEAPVRRLPALIVAATVLAALTACSGIDADDAAERCEDAPPSVDSTALIESSGDITEAPDVSFPTPLFADTVQASELIRGDGAPVVDGEPILLRATILDGGSAAVLQQSDYAAPAGILYTVGDPAVPGLGEGLECSSVGSRVAVVTPAGDDAAGAPATVYVLDIADAFLPRATGTQQLPENDLPSVVTAPDGTPGLTIPNAAAPSDYRKAVLVLGNGATVEEDSLVVVKYTAVDWNTREVTESLWSGGSASVLDLSGDTVSAGLASAVKDQPVGSQILAVIPPGLNGVGGQPAASDATLVYVVDILGIINR